tara:strand:+ start:42 stop:245 length:204 start_codon:yes stop_codon:yes gene_type:complete
MDSQEWAEQFPKTTARFAASLIKAHNVPYRIEPDAIWYDDGECEAKICDIDENEEVSSQQLVDGLGY